MFLYELEKKKKKGGLIIVLATFVSDLIVACGLS